MARALRNRRGHDESGNRVNGKVRPEEAAMSEEQKVQFSIKPVYAFGASHGLEKEVNDIRDMVIEWNSSYTTSVRKGYLVELFEKHGILDEFKAKHWMLGNTPAGEKERQRVLRIKEQYEAFLKGVGPAVSSEEEVDELLFPLESHLRDFIAANIGNIKPHGLALHLYVDSSGRNGIEYPTGVGSTGVGPIDVLAEDSNGDLVVFELKLSKGPDRAVGQALRYMGWVTKHLASGKKVSGVIVAHEIDEKLKYAVSVTPNITVFEYKVRFDLYQAGLS
jgi:hypothetical protein